MDPSWFSIWQKGLHKSGGSMHTGLVKVLGWTPRQLYIFFAVEIVLAGTIMLLDVALGSALLLVGIAMIAALWVLDNRPHWIPIGVRTSLVGIGMNANRTGTTRSLCHSAQTRMLQLLRDRVPDGGTVKIRLVSTEFEPLAAVLDSVFKLAGWYSSYNKTPLAPHQEKFVQGVEVKGFNRHVVDTIAEIFRSVGMTDLEITMMRLEVPESNPKWPTAQRTVYLVLGYPRE